MYVCVCVQVLAKNLLLVKLGLLALPAETLADADAEEASSAGMHPLRVTQPSSVSREGTLTCRGVWRGGAG